MPKINRIAHFSIPVSDMDRSIKFYTDVVGCTLIRRSPDQTFLDAGGTCILLCLQNEPVNRSDQFDYVHHAFDIGPEQYSRVDDHLAKHGVEVLYSEDRSGGTVNGPRTYFRDPDGTRLEFIHLTSYDPTPGTNSKITPIKGEPSAREPVRG
jgi:catechol 2,3-dioxygenase-like lactoylglutathione lyase family enzyme